MDIDRLYKYVDQLQSRGGYVFTENDVMEALQCSVVAFRHAALRLIAKKRIARVRPGYYVIVPMEYNLVGVPPPNWYIDKLMRDYYILPYYVGLLTAAALYGAAHQQPQVFQIITTKVLKPIILPRTKIRFYVKKNINDQFLTRKNTPTGYMTVSSPELTALDLVQYIESAGHLNNVATVLIELVETIDVNRLVVVAKQFPLAIVQRLGFLLETFTELTIEPLYQWVSTQDTRAIGLRADRGYKKSKQNKRWKIWVNEKVEPDL
jgi:predicted transcriptional regulator of viral defense system